MQRQRDRFTPAQRALLAGAIAQMYGANGHREGAQLATLAQIRQTSTLPAWAIASLAEGRVRHRRQSADLTALRRARHRRLARRPPRGRGTTSRSGRAIPSGREASRSRAGAHRPALLDRGVRGCADRRARVCSGAWLLSRSVVRPVRRLAEASGRLAEGEAGVTVKPEGPRELRELAVSFNDMNAKLTKAQETEQAFLLSVSHELKTPLTSIRGYAEGIGDGTVKPDEGAAVIGAESSRLERLVGDLLESGRMRKAAFTVRREAVDLAAVGGGRRAPLRRHGARRRPHPAHQHGGRRRRGRRPRPRAPGRLQPGRERDPLHAVAGHGHHHHGAWDHHGLGHRARPDERRPAARLRALLPLQPVRHRPAGRHRPRAGDRQGAHGGHGRHGERVQRRRRRDRVHRGAAGGRRLSRSRRGGRGRSAGGFDCTHRRRRPRRPTRRPRPSSRVPAASPDPAAPAAPQDDAS